MILAGDVGGTKTALGLYRKQAGPGDPVAERVFSSQEHKSLEEMADIFLKEERPGPIESACFAIAGPVLSGKATVTNLPWTVTDTALSRVLNTDCIRMINDVQAVACAVPLLRARDLHTLSAGRRVEKGTVAVIAVGTGLGESFLTWDGTSYISHPTEGGHTDFGPADEQQAGLLAFVGSKRGHVSWETVCSGIGIPNIYEYLKSTGQYPDAGIANGQGACGPELTPAIIGAAVDGDPPDPLCSRTLEVFASILGAESGNLALKTMATGGLYLGGGIPPRILTILENGLFLRAFKAKGRLAPLMEEIPVHVILEPGAALMGAAWEAFRIHKG